MKIAGLVISTLIFWGSFLVILFWLEPQSANFLGIFLFYFILFFTVSGLWALIGFGISKIFKRNYRLFTFWRQGLLLGGLIAGLLLLKKFEILNWWLGLILFLIIFSLEFYLSRHDSPTN